MNDLKKIFKRQRPSLPRANSANATRSRRNPLVRAFTDMGSKLKTWWRSEIGANSSDEEVAGPPPQKRYRKSTSISGDQMANDEVEDQVNVARDFEDQTGSRTTNKHPELSNTQLSTSGCSRKRVYSETVTTYQSSYHNRTGFCFNPPVAKECHDGRKAINDITYCRSPAKQSVITRKNCAVFLNDATVIENVMPSVTGCSLGQRKQSRGSLFPTQSNAGTNRSKNKQQSGTVTKMTRPVLAQQSAVHMSPSSSSGEGSPPRATETFFGRRNILCDSMNIDSSDSEAPRTQQPKHSLHLHPPAIRFGGMASTPIDPESLWFVSSPCGSAIQAPNSDAELSSPSRHVSQLLEAHRVPLPGTSKKSAAALDHTRRPSGPPATMALLQLKQRSRIMETNKAARQMLSSQSSTQHNLTSEKEEERPGKRTHPGKSSVNKKCKTQKLTSVKPPVRSNKEPVAEKESMSGSKQKPKSGSRSKSRSTGQALVTSAGPKPSMSARPRKSTSATRLPSKSVRSPKSTSATRPRRSSTSCSKLRNRTEEFSHLYSFDKPESSMQQATTETYIVSTSSDENEMPVSPILPCTTSVNQWKCLECWIRNIPPAKKCVACGAAKPSSKKTGSTLTAPLVKEQDSQWKCDNCWVSNKSNVQTCVACGASNPGLKKTGPALLEENSTCTAPLAVENPNQNNWTCNDCWISNKVDANKCVACGASKPGSNKKVLNADPPAPLDGVFLAIVSKQKSKWQCSSCLTSNEPSKARCQCCDMEREGPSKELTPKPFNFPKDSNTNFKFGMDPKEQELSIAKKRIEDEKAKKYENSLLLLPGAALSCAASASGPVPAPAASQAPGPAHVLDPTSEPCATPAATPESTESPSSAPQFAFMSNPTTLTNNVPTTFNNREETEAAVGFTLDTRTTSTSETSGMPVFSFGASFSVAPSTASAGTQPAPVPACSATQPATSMFATPLNFSGLPQTQNYSNMQNQGAFGSSVFGENSTNQTSVFNATPQPTAFGSGVASQPFGATSVNQTAAFGSSSMPQHATFTTFGGSSTGLPSSFGGSNTGLLPQFGGNNAGQTTFVEYNPIQSTIFSTGGSSQAAPFAAPFSLPTQQPAAPRPMFNFSGVTQPVFGFGQAGPAPSGGFNFGALQTMDPPLGGVQFSVGSVPSGVASTRRMRKAVRRNQPR